MQYNIKEVYVSGNKNDSERKIVEIIKKHIQKSLVQENPIKKS